MKKNCVAEKVIVASGIFGCLLLIYVALSCGSPVVRYSSLFCSGPGAIIPHRIYHPWLLCFSVSFMTGKWTIRASTQDSANNDPPPASISLNLFASSYPRAVLSSNFLNFPGHCACSLWKTCEAVDLSWLVLGTGFYWSTTTCQLKSSQIDVGLIFALSQYNLESFSIWHIFHRCDSIQGNDYIANYIVLSSWI